MRLGQTWRAVVLHMQISTMHTRHALALLARVLASRQGICNLIVVHFISFRAGEWSGLGELV